MKSCSKEQYGLKIGFAIPWNNPSTDKVNEQDTIAANTKHQNTDDEPKIQENALTYFVLLSFNSIFLKKIKNIKINKS
jgi:hypothetical protein